MPELPLLEVSKEFVVAEGAGRLLRRVEHLLHDVLELLLALLDRGLLRLHLCLQLLVCSSSHGGSHSRSVF